MVTAQRKGRRWEFSIMVHGGKITMLFMGKSTTNITMFNREMSPPTGSIWIYWLWQPLVMDHAMDPLRFFVKIHRNCLRGFTHETFMDFPAMFDDQNVFFFDWWPMAWVPSGELTVCYWTWPFIVDFPIKNGGSFHGKMLVHQRVWGTTTGRARLSFDPHGRKAPGIGGDPNDVGVWSIGKP